MIAAAVGALGVGLTSEAARWLWGHVPRRQRAPSWYLHLGWNLRTPVHRGAASRPRPLAALGRITDYYAATLRSDRGPALSQSLCDDFHKSL